MMSKRSVTSEEKLNYQARMDEKSDEYLKWLPSQTEEGLQARTKELEEDNRALSVANAHVVACEQAANRDNSRLLKNNDSLEVHIVTLGEHYDAEIKNRDATVQSKDAVISDLENRYGEVVRDCNALRGLAPDAGWESQKARISMLESNNAALTTRINDRDATTLKDAVISSLGAAVQSRDAVISRLEKEMSNLAEEKSKLRNQVEVEERARKAEAMGSAEEKRKLEAQVSVLRNELEAAKKANEMATANQSSPFSTYLATPNSSVAGGRYPPIPASASPFGSTRPSFGDSFYRTPMTPVSAEHPKTASSFPPQQSSSRLLFGNGNPNDPRAFSEKDMINVSDCMDEDEDMADGGPIQDSGDADSEGEPMDDSDDTPMVDDGPTIAPAAAQSSFSAHKMGRYTVTKGVVNDPGKKQRIAAFEADSGAARHESPKDGAANEPTRSSQDLTPNEFHEECEKIGLELPENGVANEPTQSSQDLTPDDFWKGCERIGRELPENGTANESSRLIPDIGKELDAIAAGDESSGPKGPMARPQADADPEEGHDFEGVLKESKDTGFRLAQVAEASNSRTTANNAVREPAGPVKEELDFAGILKEPKKTGRAGSNLAAPKGPKATRTGANGGVRKLANSSATGPAALRQRLGQQPAGARGAGQREPQSREVRSSGSGMASLRGEEQASRGSGSQPPRDYGLIKYGAPNPRVEGPVKVPDGPSSRMEQERLRNNHEPQTEELTELERLEDTYNRIKERVFPDNRAKQLEQAALRGGFQATQGGGSQSQTEEPRDEGVFSVDDDSPAAKRARKEKARIRRENARGVPESPSEFDLGFQKYLKDKAEKRNTGIDPYADSREQQEQKRLAKEQKRNTRGGQ